MSTLAAIISLAAETARFNADIAKAANNFTSNMNAMQLGARGLIRMLGAVAAPTALLAMVKSTVDARSKLDDLSESTSLSVEMLSRLERSAYVGGHSLEGIASGASKFARSVAEAQGGNRQLVQSFEALGISQKQLRDQKFDELYVDFAKKIALAENQQFAIAHATKLAGKAAADSIPFWNDLAKSGLEQGRVTAEQAAEAEKLEKDTKRLMLALRDLKDDALGPLITDLGKTAEAMVKAQRAGEGFFAVVAAGLQQLLTGDDAHKIDRQITAAGEAFANAQQALQNAKVQAAEAGNTPFDLDQVKRFEREVVKAKAELEKLVAIRPLMVPTPPPPTPLPGGQVKAPGSDEATQKRQIAAIQALEEKKKSLFKLNEQEIVQARITDGTFKGFDATTKARLLQIAREIDSRTQLIERIDLESEAAKHEIEVRERMGSVVSDMMLTGRAAAEQMRFETGLIGKTADEQERLNEIRKIELDLRAQKMQAAKAFGPEGGELSSAQAAALAATTAQLEQQAERKRKAVSGDIGEQQGKRRLEIATLTIEAIEHETSLIGLNRLEIAKSNALRSLEIQQHGHLTEEQRKRIVLTEEDQEKRRRLIEVVEEAHRVERDWSTGAIQGLLDYADAATNTAAMVRGAFLNAFGEMEDALLKFIKTGKLNFRDFANAVIDDMLRIIIRTAITGPIAEKIGGIIKDVFGIGGKDAGGGAGVKVLDAAAVKASVSLGAVATAAGSSNLSLVAFDKSVLAAGTTLVSVDAALVNTTTALYSLAAAAEAAAVAQGGSAGAGLASGGLISLFGGSGGAGTATGASDIFMVTTTGFAQHGGRIKDPTFVGERGVELFVPDLQGTVIPHHRLKEVISGPRAMSGPIERAIVKAHEFFSPEASDKMGIPPERFFAKGGRPPVGLPSIGGEAGIELFVRDSIKRLAITPGRADVLEKVLGEAKTSERAKEAMQRSGVAAKPLGEEAIQSLAREAALQRPPAALTARVLEAALKAPPQIIPAGGDPKLVGLGGPKVIIPMEPGTIIPHDKLEELSRIGARDPKIAGERGIEIFVPDVTGTVIPNLKEIVSEPKAMSAPIALEAGDKISALVPPERFFAKGGRPPVGLPSVGGERGSELFIPDSLGKPAMASLKQAQGLVADVTAMPDLSEPVRDQVVKQAEAFKPKKLQAAVAEALAPSIRIPDLPSGPPALNQMARAVAQDGALKRKSLTDAAATHGLGKAFAAPSVRELDAVSKKTLVSERLTKNVTERLTEITKEREPKMAPPGRADVLARAVGEARALEQTREGAGRASGASGKALGGEVLQPVLKAVDAPQRAMASPASVLEAVLKVPPRSTVGRAMHGLSASVDSLREGGAQLAEKLLDPLKFQLGSGGADIPSLKAPPEILRGPKPIGVDGPKVIMPMAPGTIISHDRLEELSRPLARGPQIEPSMSPFEKAALAAFQSGRLFESGGRPAVGVSSIAGERGVEMFLPDATGFSVPDVGGSAAQNQETLVVNQTIQFSANTPAAVRDAVFALAPALQRAAEFGVRDARERGR
jgi:hypothetical protein